MKIFIPFALGLLIAWHVSSEVAAENTPNSPLTVTISDIHLCCKGCTSAVEKAASKVPDVKCTASEDESKAVLTASSSEMVQKAIDEIAAAGFCGTLDNTAVTFKPIKFAPGNVKKLEVAHVHNCCMGCAEAIQGAVESVPGVSSHTVKNKQVSFIVEGDFSPDEVVKSLQAAGFYPTIKGQDPKLP